MHVLTFQIFIPSARITGKIGGITPRPPLPIVVPGTITALLVLSSIKRGWALTIIIFQCLSPPPSNFFLNVYAYSHVIFTEINSGIQPHTYLLAHPPRYTRTSLHTPL